MQGHDNTISLFLQIIRNVKFLAPNFWMCDNFSAANVFFHDFTFRHFVVRNIGLLHNRQIEKVLERAYNQQAFDVALLSKPNDEHFRRHRFCGNFQSLVQNLSKGFLAVVLRFVVQQNDIDIALVVAHARDVSH